MESGDDAVNPGLRIESFMSSRSKAPENDDEDDDDERPPREAVRRPAKKHGKTKAIESEDDEELLVLKSRSVCNVFHAALVGLLIGNGIAFTILMLRCHAS